MTSIWELADSYQLHKVTRRKARQDSDLKAERSGIIHAESLDPLRPGLL